MIYTERQLPQTDSSLLPWLHSLLGDPHRLGTLAEILPEVAALRGVLQRPDFHGEGDVLTHTRLALEALPDTAQERVIWAVVLHDIGKASTTCLHNGVWQSRGHAEVGAEMVPGVLARLGKSALAEDVVWLVRHHQFHLSWQNIEGRLSSRQLRFCTHPLFAFLVEVCRADDAASFGSTKGLILNRILEKLALAEAASR